MKRFEHIFSNPTQQASSYLDEIRSNPRGWFTDPSSTAPIHSFFRQDMFSDVSLFDGRDATFGRVPFPNGLYQSLVPALRLASAMFVESLEYWKFILTVPVHKNPVTGVEHFDFTGIRNNWPSPFWRRVLEEEMEMMSRGTQICWFRAEDSNVEDYSSTYGMTTTYHKPNLSTVGRSKLRLRIAVSKRLFDAVNDSAFDSKPYVEQCIIHLSIAITLVHELAHCLYRHKIWQRYLTKSAGIHCEIWQIREPLVEPFLKQELGFMFEVFLFGGGFHAGDVPEQNSRNRTGNRRLVLDGSTGLEVLLPADESSRQVKYRISDETILMLLHETTWQCNGRVPMYLLPESTV